MICGSYEDSMETVWSVIDPFPKRHKLVHNARFSNFEALYYSLNVISSTEGQSSTKCRLSSVALLQRKQSWPSIPLSQGYPTVEPKIAQNV